MVSFSVPPSSREDASLHRASSSWPVSWASLRCRRAARRGRGGVPRVVSTYRNIPLFFTDPRKTLDVSRLPSPHVDQCACVWYYELRVPPPGRGKGPRHGSFGAVGTRSPARGKTDVPEGHTGVQTKVDRNVWRSGTKRLRDSVLGRWTPL